MSISLDDNKDKWLRSAKEEGIEWVSLWDKKGFKDSEFKKEFGFQQIPFIVLVGKDGKIIARNIRGEQVKIEIENYRKQD